MSGDDYKYQMSAKFGPGGIGMINVRADDPEEFANNVNAAVAAVGPASVLVEALNTEFQGVSAANATAPAPAPYPQQAQAQGGQICVHGQMVARSGVKNGKPWSGWFCPTPQGTPGQCAAKFNR